MGMSNGVVSVKRKINYIKCTEGEEFVCFVNG